MHFTQYPGVYLVQDRVALSLRSEAEQIVVASGLWRVYKPLSRSSLPLPSRGWDLEMFVEALFHPPEEIGEQALPTNAGHRARRKNPWLEEPDVHMSCSLTFLEETDPSAIGQFVTRIPRKFRSPASQEAVPPAGPGVCTMLLTDLVVKAKDTPRGHSQILCFLE